MRIFAGAGLSIVLEARESEARQSPLKIFPIVSIMLA